MGRMPSPERQENTANQALDNSLDSSRRNRNSDLDASKGREEFRPREVKKERNIDSQIREIEKGLQLAKGTISRNPELKEKVEQAIGLREEEIKKHQEKLTQELMAIYREEKPNGRVKEKDVSNFINNVSLDDLKQKGDRNRLNEITNFVRDNEDARQAIVSYNEKMDAIPKIEDSIKLEIGNRKEPPAPDVAGRDIRDEDTHTRNSDKIDRDPTRDDAFSRLDKLGASRISEMVDRNESNERDAENNVAKINEKFEKKIEELASRGFPLTKDAHRQLEEARATKIDKINKSLAEAKDKEKKEVGNYVDTALKDEKIKECLKEAYEREQSGKITDEDKALISHFDKMQKSLDRNGVDVNIREEVLGHSVKKIPERDDKSLLPDKYNEKQRELTESIKKYDEKIKSLQESLNTPKYAAMSGLSIENARALGVSDRYKEYQELQSSLDKLTSRKDELTTTLKSNQTNMQFNLIDRAEEIRNNPELSKIVKDYQLNKINESIKEFNFDGKEQSIDELKESLKGVDRPVEGKQIDEMLRGPEERFADISKKDIADMKQILSRKDYVELRSETQRAADGYKKALSTALKEDEKYNKAKEELDTFLRDKKMSKADISLFEKIRESEMPCNSDLYKEWDRLSSSVRDAHDKIVLEVQTDSFSKILEAHNSRLLTVQEHLSRFNENDIKELMSKEKENPSSLTGKEDSILSLYRDLSSKETVLYQSISSLGGFNLDGARTNRYEALKDSLEEDKKQIVPMAIRIGSMRDTQMGRNDTKQDRIFDKLDTEKRSLLYESMKLSAERNLSDIKKSREDGQNSPELEKDKDKNTSIAEKINLREMCTKMKSASEEAKQPGIFDSFKTRFKEKFEKRTINDETKQSVSLSETAGDYIGRGLGIASKFIHDRWDSVSGSTMKFVNAIKAGYNAYNDSYHSSK